MNFAFTEDQLALKEGMASFFAAEIPAERLRRLIEHNEGRSPELRAKIAEQGLFGLSIPEDAGGLGLSDIDWALMTPELGYYAIPDFVAETACVSSGLLANRTVICPVARAMPGSTPSTFRSARMVRTSSMPLA